MYVQANKQQIIASTISKIKAGAVQNLLHQHIFANTISKIKADAEQNTYAAPMTNLYLQWHSSTWTTKLTLWS